MRISDMLSSLAKSTKGLEGQMDEWYENLSVESDQALAKIQEWRRNAERRADAWNAEFSAYSNGVDEKLKGQLAELQAGFETQMNAARTQVAAWRADAEKKDADTRADWYEAYAANMVAVTKRAEQEASAAIAAAAEARAKARKAG